MILFVGEYLFVGEARFPKEIFMAITVKKSPAWVPGQGLTMSGTGPGMVVPPTGGGGGGGGGGPLDPTGVSGLKLRYNVLSGYSNLTQVANQGETWYPTVSPGSQAPQVHTGGGWMMRSTNFGAEPNFNGYGSIWTQAQPTTDYNGYWDGIYSLNIPGGQAARTIYLVGMFPSIPSGEGEMFGYGTQYKGWFGFSIVDGRLACRCFSLSGQTQMYSTNPAYNAYDASSKLTAPITAGVPFVVSYAYAEGTNMKDNDIRLNGVVGTYGSGAGGAAFGTTMQDYDMVNTVGIVGDRGRINFSVSMYYNNTWTHKKSNHYVADTLVFDSAHDATTRAGIESWLMSRYGISA